MFRDIPEITIPRPIFAAHVLYRDAFGEQLGN
jgi:hypothetical protein